MKVRITMTLNLIDNVNEDNIGEMEWLKEYVYNYAPSSYSLIASETGDEIGEIERIDKVEFIMETKYKVLKEDL